MKRILTLLAVVFICFSACMVCFADDIVHTVKKGDTLWDISSQYLETPWKWPLVWARNQDITNPHLIYPNDVVIISKQGNKTVITIVPAQPSESEEVEEAITYTPGELAEEKEHSVVVSPKFSTYIYSPNILTGTGNIFKKQGIGELASMDELVLIRKSVPLQSGQGITVVSKVQDIKSDKKVIGYLYKAIGIATVEEVNGNIAKAKITYSNQEIKSSDIIFDDLASIRPFTVTMTEPSLSDSGSIVDLYGGITGSSALDLVFINVGKSQGVDRGALLSIYKETTLEQDRAMFRDYQGLALVLQSLDTSSMALVIDSKGPIERDFVVAGAEID